MKLNIALYARNKQKEEEWLHSLATILDGIIDLGVTVGDEGDHLSRIIFLDSEILNLRFILDKIDRTKQIIFLLVDESSSNPELLVEERVDDVLVLPFRRLDVLSKIRYARQIILWNEVIILNKSMSDTIKFLQDDLCLAENLQKARLPKRFYEIKGFDISSRYLAGLRAGGDYFDLAESSDGRLLSLLFSDSSSYGLASAVLSALMRVTLKFTSNQLSEDGMILKTFLQIRDELLHVLQEEDELSLFYGSYSRKDQYLRFVNLGRNIVFYGTLGHSIEIIVHQGEALSMASKDSIVSEGKIKIVPDGRLIVISSGFIDVLGGIEKMHQLVQDFQAKEREAFLNELTFRLKSKLFSEDDIPARDCSALILDANLPGLQLLKPVQGENEA